jgi:hypothetical protein
MAVDVLIDEAPSEARVDPTQAAQDICMLCSGWDLFPPLLRFVQASQVIACHNPKWLIPSIVEFTHGQDEDVYHQ